MSRFTKVVVIDPATHPGFVRMREKEGFTEFGEAEVDAMVKAPGLKFVVFADDPNKQKETLDIVVIAPEVKKTLPQVESAWVTDTAVGRALGDAKAPGRRALPRGSVLGRRRRPLRLGRLRSGVGRNRLPHGPAEAHDRGAHEAGGRLSPKPPVFTHPPTGHEFRNTETSRRNPLWPRNGW